MTFTVLKIITADKWRNVVSWKIISRKRSVASGLLEKRRAGLAE